MSPTFKFKITVTFNAAPAGHLTDAVVVNTVPEWWMAGVEAVLPFLTGKGLSLATLGRAVAGEAQEDADTVDAALAGLDGHRHCPQAVDGGCPAILGRGVCL